MKKSFINTFSRRELIEQGFLPQSNYAGTYTQGPTGQADVYTPPPATEAPGTAGGAVIDMRSGTLWGYPKNKVYGWAFLAAIAALGIYFIAKKWS